MAGNVTLVAEPRDQTGKGSSRAIRRAGRIPAVIYGDKQDPIAVSLAYKSVLAQVNTGSFLSQLVDVEIVGKKVRTIPRDIQFDPARDFIMHVDFLRLSKGARISVEVQVNFLNEETCPGLKAGGVLNIVRYTVELSCPADSIPESIEIDLAEVAMGDSIHISSVTLPDGVTPTITDRDFTVATIAAPAIEAEEDTEEEVPEEAEAEPEDDEQQQQ